LIYGRKVCWSVLLNFKDITNQERGCGLSSTFLFNLFKNGSSPSLYSSAYAVHSFFTSFAAGKVHFQSPSVEIGTIQLRHSVLCSLSILEFAKAEALEAVGCTIVNQARKII